MNSHIHILVIDDEESWCEILKYNLEREGYDVDTADSAETALTYDLAQYNLLIVDIMMEAMSGFDFARRVRNNPDPVVENIPIIFCSALDAEDDLVKGLNIGADDYITKPFNIGEAIARVKAVLRRASAHPVLTAEQQPTPVQPVAHKPKQPELPPVTVPDSYEDDITFKQLRLDRNGKRCYIGNKDIDLTRIEFDLMLFFLTHRERVHSREEIMQHVWGAQVTKRTIDVSVARLRSKLGDYRSHIDTRQGFGYCFRTDI